MKKIKGRLKICRPNRSDGRECMTLDLTDVDAGVQFVSVEMPLEDFMRCLTASPVECSLEVRQLDLVGTVKQRKVEIVRVSDLWREKGEREEDRLLRVRAAVAEHEVDGWKGRDEDALNHYNRSRVHDMPDGFNTLMAWRVVYERHIVLRPKHVDE